jgi:methionyl-tRNA formyltransferase
MGLRLVMMGTGSFAVPTFQGLFNSPHEVVGLVTQPDRTGRGHHHHVNPMKELAQAHKTPVFQPQRANGEDSLARLREFAADLIVVAAYGQILSADLLSIPRLGAINVHASLLPKYRGAAPINYAILCGEVETGVTIFQIEPHLDAGPMLARVATPIGPKETAGELEQRLASLAVAPTLEVIGQLESGTTRPLPQDRRQVTKAPRMPKQMGEVDWSQPSARIACHIRAMQPWPKPYTFLHQSGRDPLRTLILDVEPVDLPESARPTSPGDVAVVSDDDLLVRTGDGAVAIREIQPAGKRAMPVADFLHGHAVHLGDQFGPEAMGESM